MTLHKATVRATIALACLAMLMWLQGWWNGARPGGPAFSGGYSPVQFPLVMATVLSGCASLGWILLTVMETWAVGELRCRKCRYVLRGLSAPRCPECGEPI